MFVVEQSDSPDLIHVRTAGIELKGNLSDVHTEIMPLQLHEIMRSYEIMRNNEMEMLSVREYLWDSLWFFLTMPLLSRYMIIVHTCWSLKEPRCFEVE